MSNLVQDFNSLLDHYGLAAMFVSLTVETLGLPAPGESAMIAASAMAGDGHFKFWHVAVVAWCAALLGDNIGYFLGRRLGRPTVLAYGGRFGITDARFAQAEAVLDRYGFFVVLVARFLPLLRQLNGLVAGTAEMKWRRFLLADMVGSACWVGVWGTIGYQVGHVPGLIPDLWMHLKTLATVIVPALIAAMVVLTILRLRSTRSARKAAQDRNG